MDNSPSNKNVPDPRNWQGSGNRSVANMFIDLGNRVSLTDDQFQEEMAKRRAENPGRRRHPWLPAVRGQCAGRENLDPESESATAVALGEGTPVQGVLRTGDHEKRDAVVPKCVGGDLLGRIGHTGDAVGRTVDGTRAIAVVYERPASRARLRRLGTGRQRSEVLPVWLYEPELGRGTRFSRLGRTTGSPQAMPIRDNPRISCRAGIGSCSAFPCRSRSRTRTN